MLNCQTTFFLWQEEEYCNYLQYIFLIGKTVEFKTKKNYEKFYLPSCENDYARLKEGN